MMGCKSKATKKRIQNLPAPTISHKVTVEEVPDEESDTKYLPEKENQLEGEGEVIDGILARLEGLENEGFSEWDEEDMEDNDEEAEFEIKDDTALLTFTQTLQRAHVSQSVPNAKSHLVARIQTPSPSPHQHLSEVPQPDRSHKSVLIIPDWTQWASSHRTPSHHQNSSQCGCI